MVEPVWIPDANQMCPECVNCNPSTIAVATALARISIALPITAAVRIFVPTTLSIPLGALLLLENVFDHISLFCFMTSVSRQGIYHL